MQQWFKPLQREEEIGTLQPTNYYAGELFYAYLRLYGNRNIVSWYGRLLYLLFKTGLKIVFQHYPLYRESDNVCTEPDAAPLPERNSLFEERWDCLSKESTEYLVESLHPRAAFGAHTHHSCVVRHSFVPTPDHKIEFIEYTVPSFSWRNRLDPKYYLVSENYFITFMYNLL